MKKVLVLTAGLLLAASTAFAQLGTTSPSGTLALNVAAEAGLVVNTATTTLTESGSGANFQPYTGTTGLTYYIRTSSSGTGTIGLRVSTDFAPAPVAHPSEPLPLRRRSHLRPHDQ